MESLPGICFLLVGLVGTTFAGNLADSEVNPVFDYAKWKEASTVAQSGSDSTTPPSLADTLQDDSFLVAETVAPSLSSNLYALLNNKRNYRLTSNDKTTRIPLPFSRSATGGVIGNGQLFKTSNDSTGTSAEGQNAGSINPTRARSRTVGFVDGDEGHDRFKRCMTCGAMGMDGNSGGNAPMPNIVDMGQQFDNGNSNKLLVIGNILNDGSGTSNRFSGGQNMGSQQQGQIFIKQGGDQGGGFMIGSGTQTIAGAMRTTITNGMAYTLSSYTRIVNGAPTIGVVTIGPVQTYYQGKLLEAGQNPYGVPNQGTYTLSGAMSTYQSDGYPMTVSSYTRIVDGTATYGAITLAGMQTQYNGRLLQGGQNPYGVPNQGVYTIPGGMATSMMNGSPVTMSTYTKIVDGVATYGTVTIGSMQTYYQGKLLLPGDNIYGVPNQGTYTIPGSMATSMVNGYAMTLSTYTRIVNGVATYGTITLGTMQTYYQGKLLQPGENAYGVPNQGTYTLQGAMSTALDANGYPFTVSTYTKIVDGAATFGTVTLGSMQTMYNGRLLKAGENAYNVPNRGVYTLDGLQSRTQINGYDATLSTYTKIVDGIATFGTVTLGSMQTFYNGKLLQPGQNAYGVPNVGVYTVPGQMSVIQNTDGYPMTVSTYTKIVDGQATFGTITLGSMQTYYNGRVLRPDENAYGVPNVGSYTLPGPMSTLVDTNGYPITISSYTKIINGRATFGSVTQGIQVTYYNGKILRYGENPFGVPAQGVYTLPGSMETRRINGADQTLSTYTRIVNGVATYGTITIGAMQTFFIPNQAPTSMQGSFSNQAQDTMQGSFIQQNSNQNRVIDSGSNLIPNFLASAAQPAPAVSFQVVPVSSNQGSSSFQSSSQNSNSNRFIDSGNVQGSFTQQRSNQNRVINSGSNLIPDFLASAAQPAPAPSVNFQVVPVSSNQGSSFFQSSSQNSGSNRVADSSNGLIQAFINSGPSVPVQVFPAGSSSSSTSRFTQTIIDTSGQAPDSVQVIPVFSRTGISGGSNRFAQVVDQISQLQNQGSSQQQGIFQSLNQGNQGSSSSQFAQVLDQVGPMLDRTIPTQDANGALRKSIKIQTVNRVSGVLPGDCGNGKKK